MMPSLNKTIVLLFLVLTGIAHCVYSQSSVAIVPTPLNMLPGKGNFTFSALTVIRTAHPEDPAVRFLQNYLLEQWRYRNPVQSSSKAVGSSLLEITGEGTEGFEAEEYELVVSPAKITLKGKGAGLFYGIQSLIQLFPNQRSGTASLPCIKIKDRPRFGYRGLMLDVSRHFFTVRQVKDLLDLMAQYKLNRFHWHLTDDQGWRIEIRSYPKLTEVGAWRVPRLGDFNQMIDPPKPGEKATDGGYYTQEEIKEVVRYASERQIEVIPEIDVPGHCMAAIAAYPELSVTKNPETKVNPGSSFARWFPGGGFEMYVDNALNPTDEKVYQFLDQVIGEVAQLFPYKYLHIGGDECYKGFWEKDAGVQAFMKRMNIKDMHALQSYFIGRVNDIVRAKNKQLIGWDEILEGGATKGVAVMNRFGAKSAGEQARQQIPLVMAPGNQGLYFDYAQSASDMEPINHGGYSPLWKSYNYDPVPPGLSKTEAQYILGVEGCIWTEHIGTVSKLQYMILPRMLGLAETGWSEVQRKNYEHFSKNVLPVHLERFEQSGANYRVPNAFSYTDTVLVGTSFNFNLIPPVPGSKIYYTLNNKMPGDFDHEYKQPMDFVMPESASRVLKTIVITPSGRRSVVTRTVMYNPKLLPSLSSANLRRGLKYKVYKDSLTSLTQPLVVKDVDSGITKTITLPEKYAGKSKGLIAFEGFISMPKDDVYHFSSANKSVQIYIGGKLAFDSENPKSDKPLPLFLQKGQHQIQVNYLFRAENPKLALFFRSHSAGEIAISESMLAH
ncbi:family 20 glycosylhydrolase [Pedobacter heparinus]|uniref:beta-N-acetylhexosaminidase n=1 Tax=Pedobacter heparinus (strain ATCC 13125 / DSM 2366 / CIP 104194 / JCM 7457 / NBRC 12017 / NCIMB 9290 / NRRL B-14731 / HIM 762-3) TaxID=485917 RepID=C6Y0Z2_PEDHD|nr:family 20 glycosylhydrolase [Pedobacter heparinus]ACU04919.1 Beta-N-acetylhexosaminidase [Pedobacter heparinus DSM 2366]